MFCSSPVILVVSTKVTLDTCLSPIHMEGTSLIPNAERVRREVGDPKVVVNSAEAMTGGLLEICLDLGEPGMVLSVSITEKLSLALLND